MSPASSVRRAGAVLAAAFLICVAVAAALFPRAFPILALDQRLTPALAEQHADSFARAHDLPRAGRVATRFEADGRGVTFLDLRGGPDTVRAIARGTDDALYSWHVRWFTAGDPHETRVALAPDGRVIGFTRTLADADTLPPLHPDTALRLAESVRDGWLRETPSRWRLATSSYETKPGSGRIDRTFVFERSDRRLLGAPLRLTVVIAGNVPSEASASLAVPEDFERHYAEMRASNDLLAGYAQVGMVLLLLTAVVALRRFSRDGHIRWGESAIAGAVIGALLLAEGANRLSLAWYDYDTATSPIVHFAMAAGVALLGGLAMAGVVALTLAAAEAASRRAHPGHVDWYRWWPARGTDAVAGRVLAGYVLAAFGVAYVSLFYLVTRRALGWWVPIELLDDPNQIATPAPWITGIALAVQSGVWEEALFRVLPLSLLSLWVGRRPHRGRWMAAGVAATALVFGFAHANYPSWPAYSRGVELFVEACLWGAVVVRFGPLTTMVAHFLYNLFLFGLFAGAGTGPAYRVTAFAILVVLLSPILAVGWRWWRQRGLVPAGDDVRFAGWRPPEVTERPADAPAVTLRPLTPRSRAIALGVGLMGLVLTLAAPHRPTLGPEVTATRARAVAVADSALAARGVPVEGWSRIAFQVGDTMDTWPRFLRAERAESLAARYAATYRPALWWTVRYLHPHLAVEQRAEEWRVRVWPDGRLLDVRHILPDAAWRDSVSAADARALARAAMSAAGLDTARFAEATLVTDRKAGDSTRAQRTDVTLTYTDTTERLPGGALSRAWVGLAGNEVTSVRRGVELPETFLRADRGRQMTGLAAAAGCGVALVVLVIAGVVVVFRRRRPVLGDRWFTTRRAIVACGVLGVVEVAGALNGIPVALARYDTAQPWEAFTAFVGLGVMLSLVAVVFIAGLWLAFDGLRRRAGVPLVTRAESPWATTVTAAVGLAGVVAAFGGLRSIVIEPGMPPGPAASLDPVIPALQSALALPAGTVLSTMLVGLVGLVVVLLARGTAARLALALLVVALIGGTMVGAAGGESGGRVEVLALLAVGAVPAFWLALRAYAASSAVTWFVAGLLSAAFDATRTAVVGPTPTDRAGAVLALVTCGILFAFARWVVEGGASEP